MIICSCSNISDKDTKEEIIQKIKSTDNNCKNCIFFNKKKGNNICQLKA